MILSLNNANQDFTTLDAWLKARKESCFFYKSVLPLLPKEGTYGLNLQIRKESTNAAANIAEGYG